MSSFKVWAGSKLFVIIIIIIIYHDPRFTVAFLFPQKPAADRGFAMIT